MPSISRRAFVRAGSLALVSFGADPVFLDRAAFALKGARPSRGRTLVCLFQRGAVDGLNMVVPYGDAHYYRERPRIAVPRAEVLDLDSRFGLHPACAPLMPLWDSDRLAIVHAAGSPSATRSHFAAQDFMEAGTPDSSSTPDGWANRYCRHHREHRDTPFRAVGFGPSLPKTLAGGAPALAIDDLRTFGMRARAPGVRDRLTRAFEDLYEGAATGLVASSSAEGFEAIAMLKQANPSQLSPTVEYPQGRFGTSLMQVAQLIKSNLGVEIAFVDVGGWDTHVNQGAIGGQLGGRLRELAGGLAAFATDLGDRMRDVVVLTMSEFGRTVAENGTGGTDHGHGTAMLVMGGNTRGGRIVGRWPGLDPADRFEGRDLAVTTDFRSLFSEILVGHLGATNLEAVFPGYRVDRGGFPGVMG